MAEPLTFGQSAALQAGGSALSSGFNLFEAHKNRKFQREMASTAHQREVRDLKKAGLNPILSATGGRGASTPGGAQGKVDNPAEGLALLQSQLEINSAQTAKLKSAALLDAVNAQAIEAGIPFKELKGDAASAITPQVKEFIDEAKIKVDAFKDLQKKAGQDIFEGVNKAKQIPSKIKKKIKQGAKRLKRKFKKWRAK